MNAGTNDEYINMIEFGGGVPDLIIVKDETPGRGPGQPTEGGISVRMFALAATIFGQLVIGLAIAAGGNPVIGGIAAVTILICGLVLVLAEAITPTN